MTLNSYRIQYIDARKALSQGKFRQAATLAGQLFEDILAYLISHYHDHFDNQLISQIQQAEQRTQRQGKPTNLHYLVRLYTNFDIFTALEELSGNSTKILKTLDLRTCLRIRNTAMHVDSESSAEEARFLITTTEHLLAFLGVDVDLPPDWDPGSVPLRFSGAEECLHLLIDKLWEFPDDGGPRSSWAVKESKILKGELATAYQQPGLGIALFTTELASEILGAQALPKIQACVDWGLNQTTESSPGLLTALTDEGITGRVTRSLDLRHTVALAILMVRFGLHRKHCQSYLKLVLDSACPDGGWPAEFGDSESELASTVYAVEFLSLAAQSREMSSPHLQNLLHQGQEWLVIASRPEGGWATAIFQKSWDPLWSTAYLIQRLFAARAPSFPEWTQTLKEAIAFMLRDARMIGYENERIQLRVESRVAAALAWALSIKLLDSLSEERAESWLSDWEPRFLRSLKHVPSKELDLATGSFATRALLRNRQIGSLHSTSWGKST